MVDRWPKADIYARTPKPETASLSPRPNHGMLLGISYARIMSNNLFGLMTVGPQCIKGILPLDGGILNSRLFFFFFLSLSRHVAYFCEPTAQTARWSFYLQLSYLKNKVPSKVTYNLRGLLRLSTVSDIGDPGIWQISNHATMKIERALHW